jgi:uncharacterized repeat protein (TIGR01451 family)
VAAAATGVLVNTATVSPPPGVTDTDPGNDSATDTTDIILITELHGTLNDGQCWRWPGESTSYRLKVHNDGPGDALGATVVDTPPAMLVGVTWTCTASGGASCPAAGGGAIDETVDLPVGGEVEFVVSGTVDSSASGWLVNEATVAPPAGAVDPTPHNASMADWDALEPAVFCDWLESGNTGGWTSTTP